MVKGADYSISNIVYAVSTDDEKRAFYDLYKGALKGALSQINAVDLECGRQRAGRAVTSHVVVVQFPATSGREPLVAFLFWVRLKADTTRAERVT